MYSSLLSLMPIIFLTLFLVLWLLRHSWTLHLHCKVNKGRDFCPFIAHLETLVSSEVLIKYLLSEYRGKHILCSECKIWVKSEPSRVSWGALDNTASSIFLDLMSYYFPSANFPLVLSCVLLWLKKHTYSLQGNLIILHWYFDTDS